ncbi:MAG: methyltransferase domain-containing protein [Actinobacteria bacterium]|nr:methyltransferase domain-containing protein [Actinomycetota bacterium]
MQREDWNRKYAQNEQLWSAHPNRTLVAEVEDLEPGRALDLACGDGRHSVWLAERGWSVTAVDFSEVAIAKARKRAAVAGVRVAYRRGDLLDFEPAPGTFDLVLVLFLQLPADERRVVLSRAAAALADGGTFLLVGHDLLNLTEGVGGPSDVRVLYTPADIAAELPGLEIEKAEKMLRDVADADRPAIDVLVKTRRTIGYETSS